MKTLIRNCFAFLSILLLQACTIAVNNIRDPLPSNGPAPKNPCNIEYSLVIDSAAFTNTLGKDNTEDAQIEKIKSKYINSTNEALQSIGCQSAYTNDQKSSDFIISIKRQLYFSALPQEWLTGLSFGLIPSWGTRPEQYVYSFKNKIDGKSHSYIVDVKSYNHIILFPVSWITLITADEYRTYKKALINFVKNSG
ncbi:MAG: hypothetical protein ACRETO_01210 [Gammaproteobacteria bacterium]